MPRVGLFFLVVVVATAARALPRVYVAPINGDDRATARLMQDRVLVGARAMKDRFDVVGAADVQGILETEAAKAAIGCDSSSCANEIADALNAEQLLTGQLGRIGGTWQLTLTRTERKTLRVLGRASRETRGDTPEGLLDDIPRMVREVFGVEEPPASGLFVAGVVTAGVGTAAVVAGAAIDGFSWLQYFAAQSALAKKPPDVGTARSAKNTGVTVLPWAFVVGGAGLAVAAVGGALIGIDAIGGGT